jgi:hypothetical protein
LSHNQRHGRFGKLDEAATVLVAGQHDIATDFRVPVPRAPEGLAFLDVPARAGGDE